MAHRERCEGPAWGHKQTAIKRQIETTDRRIDRLVYELYGLTDEEICNCGGDNTLKPVRLSAHALNYMQSRGFSVAEVEEAIRTSPWGPADGGRLECRKDFPFHAEWNNRFYSTKQVRPIFVEETTEIVVVTVYTYFF